ncbi:sugar phosphate isomerase/epimerase [Candidatus Pelagibacter sp.]|nr:sugar phosphate isomerase/epimerase [Candidatus Pelagibacter sp.]
MKNLIGIVQGRLSISPKNRLQFFPKNWRKEFELANKIGFDFIEFFTQRKINKSNPVWDIKKLDEYKRLSKLYNLKILNFCDDYVISNCIRKKRTQNYLFKLLKNLHRLNIKNLILPMYGKSNLTDKNYSQYVTTIKNIIKNSKKIKILIESNISPKEFIDFKKKINSKKVLFLFDTGNRVNLKRDMYNDLIRMNKHIEHIHIKDKNLKKQNVKLNTGLVNFNKIFKILKKNKYRKNFTFETTRGNNPIKTAKYNLEFLKKKLS